MSAAVLAAEFAKMRHLRILPLALLLVICVVGFALATGVTSPDFDRSTSDSWNSLLAALGGALSMISPLLLAVLASRQVDVEHTGSGWLLAATAGIPAGRLCRTKLLALGILVASATAVASGAVASTGFAFGITAPWPITRWAGFTASVVLINLVLVSVHLLVSARVENQLVSIGLGLLGTLIALLVGGFPVWIAHATPWGYYSLASAAGYTGGELTGHHPSYPSIVALVVIAGLAVWVLTRRFDHQEV